MGKQKFHDRFKPLKPRSIFVLSEFQVSQGGTDQDAELCQQVLRNLSDYDPFDPQGISLSSGTTPSETLGVTMNEREKEPAKPTIVDAADRGILVWLWLGLLTSYITTSALFVTQLFASLQRNFDVYEGLSSRALLAAYAMAPAFILVLGWATFYQFTLSVFDKLMGHHTEKLDQERLDNEGRYVRIRFRMTLFLLISSWVIALLIVAFTPAAFIFYQ